jgi:hypothetical protein
MSVGCSECRGKRSCDNWHVYAIELRQVVLEKEPGFPFEGTLGRGKKIFYVGITKHTAECRYNQHVAKRNRNRSRFTCPCFTEEPELRDLKKPGKYVNEYRKKGGLSPFYFSHLNPVVRTDGEAYKGMMEELEEDAKDAEEELAEELRAEGHAVHFN